ncbi:MAG: hypothetical protein PHW63_04015 [Alphaproteobacteria bacterium]|nr:hypothetical protein [Alphaproteobacteria bacterium]
MKTIDMINLVNRYVEAYEDSRYGHDGGSGSREFGGFYDSLARLKRSDQAKLSQGLRKVASTTKGIDDGVTPLTRAMASFLLFWVHDDPKNLTEKDRKTFTTNMHGIVTINTASRDILFVYARDSQRYRREIERGKTITPTPLELAAREAVPDALIYLAQSNLLASFQIASASINAHTVESMIPFVLSVIPSYLDRIEKIANPEYINSAPAYQAGYVINKMSRYVTPDNQSDEAICDLWQQAAGTYLKQCKPALAALVSDAFHTDYTGPSSIPTSTRLQETAEAFYLAHEKDIRTTARIDSYGNGRRSSRLTALLARSMPD